MNGRLEIASPSPNGLATCRAHLSPPEYWHPSLHPLRLYIVSILNGTLDPSWRDDFAIDPMSAVELDFLAEAVKSWKGQCVKGPVLPARGL